MRVLDTGTKLWAKLVPAVLQDCFGMDEDEDIGFGLSIRKEFFAEGKDRTSPVKFVWVVLVWGDLTSAEEHLLATTFRKRERKVAKAREKATMAPPPRATIVDQSGSLKAGTQATVVRLPHRKSSDRNSRAAAERRGHGAFVTGFNGNESMPSEEL
jgi:hypothetical protein